MVIKVEIKIQRMWPKKYKDYPEDRPLIQKQVGPGNGIIGCEMHDINGWGLTFHKKKRRKNWIVRFFSSLYKKKE